MMLAHASWIELVWAMSCTVGLTCAFLNFWSARNDFLRKSKKVGALPLRVFMLHAVYSSSKVSLFAFSWMWGNALWGISHAPPPPPLTTLPQSFGNVVSWVVVVSLLTTQQVKGMQWRRKLNEGDYPGGAPTPGRRITDVAA
jgi:hypothetical protein